MSRPVEELIRLAMVYAEQDRRTMSEAADGLPDGKEAGELADEFHAYRMKRWGRTQFEANIADATTVDVMELRESTAQETPPSRADEVALPNDKWVRADKQPNWALCLDPENRFYGWKMYECNGNWVSGAKMTADEVKKALGFCSLQPHRTLLEALHATLNRSPEHG